MDLMKGPPWDGEVVVLAPPLLDCWSKDGSTEVVCMEPRLFAAVKSEGPGLMQQPGVLQVRVAWQRLRKKFLGSGVDEVVSAGPPVQRPFSLLFLMALCPFPRNVDWEQSELSMDVL